MKKADENKLRASLTEAIDRWWDGAEGLEATGIRTKMPMIGDATLAYMADAALGVLLAIEDVQVYLQETGHMVEGAE